MANYREKDLQKLVLASEHPTLKVLIGVSGCGMEGLLAAFKEYLLAIDDSTNLISVTLSEQEPSIELKSGVKNVCFLFDSPNRKDISSLVSALLQDGADLYLIQQNEFAIELKGIEKEVIEVLPQSFAEYFAISGGDVDEAFTDYVNASTLSGEAAEIRLERDIIKPILDTYHIEDVECLKKLIHTLLLSPSSTPSVRGLSRTLSENGLPKNDKTIGAYLGNLCKSRLFYPIPVYDDFRKKALGSAITYAISAPSYAVSFLKEEFQEDLLYYSLVGLELKRRGYEVSRGKIYDKNVDFLATKNGERLYIQIAFDTSYSALKKTIRPFFTFHDAYPKVVIARTKTDVQNFDGFEVYDIARWLMNK